MQIQVCDTGSSFKVLEGTSFSAPMVSGALALIKANNPALNASQIKQCLFDATFDLTNNSVFYKDFGYGGLDVQKAVVCERNLNSGLELLNNNEFCKNDTLWFRLTKQFKDLSYKLVLNEQHFFSFDGLDDVKAIIPNYIGVVDAKILIYKNDSLLKELKYDHFTSIRNCHVDWKPWVFGSQIEMEFTPLKTNRTGQTWKKAVAQYRDESIDLVAGYSTLVNELWIEERTSSYIWSVDSLTNTDFFNNQAIQILSHPTSSEKLIILCTSGNSDKYYIENGLEYVVLTKSATPPFFNTNHYIVNEHPVNADVTVKGGLITGAQIVSFKDCQSNTYIITHGHPDNLNPQAAQDFFIYKLRNTSNDSNLFEFIGQFNSGISTFSSSIRISPNNQFLALASDDASDSDFAVVFQLKDTLGQYAIYPIDTFEGIYKHVEFSPNSRYLYGFDSYEEKLFQFDLYENKPSDSKRLVCRCQNYSTLFQDMKLGPDGIIYLSGCNPIPNVISSIETPNQNCLENGCSFNLTAHTIDTTYGNLFTSGFPNNIQMRLLDSSDYKLTWSLDLGSCNITLSFDELFLDCNEDSITWNVNNIQQLTQLYDSPTFQISDLENLEINVKGKHFALSTALKLNRKLVTTNSLVQPGRIDTIYFDEHILALPHAKVKWFVDGRFLHDTTSFLQTSLPGIYWAEIYADCDTLITDKIELTTDTTFINLDFYDSAEYVFNAGLHQLNRITFGNNTYRLGPVTRLLSGTNVFINGTNIFLDSGAKIIIEPGACLNIGEVSFFSDHGWDGIKVFGVAQDTTQRFICSGTHGTVYSYGALFRDADTALISYTGGLIDCRNSLFCNNDVHVWITPYSGSHNSFFDGNYFGNIRLRDKQLNNRNAIQPSFIAQGIAKMDVQNNTFEQYFHPYFLPNLFKNHLTGAQFKGNCNQVNFLSNNFNHSHLGTMLEIDHCQQFNLTSNNIGSDTTKGIYTLNKPVFHLKSREFLKSHIFQNIFQGAEYGILALQHNTTTDDTLVITNNYFYKNTYGLVASLDTSPINNDTLANTDTTDIHLLFRCNTFFENDYGFILDKGIIDQNDGSNEHLNHFGDNIAFDGVSTKHPDSLIFYVISSTNNINIAPNLTFDSININGSFNYGRISKVDNPNLSECAYLMYTHNVSHFTKTLNRHQYDSINLLANNEYQVNSCNHLPFPNPFKTELSLSGISDDTQIEIYDCFGKNVLSKMIHLGDVIEFGNCASGIYTLKIQSESCNAKYFKVLKQ